MVRKTLWGEFGKCRIGIWVIRGSVFLGRWVARGFKDDDDKKAGF